MFLKSAFAINCRVSVHHPFKVVGNVKFEKNDAIKTALKRKST